ncbi:MAG: hypothetical protein ACK4NP_07475 [Parvularculaceae bacterium]
MPDHAIRKGEREAALKALIRDTIAKAGDLPPEAIPHRVKMRLRNQAVGDADIDKLIEEALAEQRKAGR